MYVLRGTFGFAVPRRTKLVPQVAVLKAKHSALLKPGSHEERSYSHWSSQRQNPIPFAPSSHQLLVWQPKFGPHGSGSRRGFGMFVVRALKGILKIRYLILGGAVTGGMSLQKSYQEWKDSFPDLKWLESYMPTDDQVGKFRSSLIDFKDKVKEIEIDPRIVKIGEGKLTKMQEWLNQKINDAYEAAQKSELEGSGKNIARPIRDTVQKLYEEADNKVKVKALTFGSTDTRKDSNDNEADVLRHELIEVQLKYQKEIERLEKDNKELKKQLLLSKSSRTHHKQIKKSLIDMYSEVLDELNDYDSSYAAQDHLPRVVVVGDQSAGKTSVLEMIAQARIFPRGAGEMMTRSPVKVTLSEGPYHIAQFKDSDREFDLTKEDDLRKLRTEVELRMKRSLSKGKSVSQDVISMTVKGPGLQRMVLVDLPGIISTVTTDMAQDTRDSIRKMIQQHMSNPNAIILCIQDGSVDAERSNVTDLVAQMDPSGKRTIFVLTKVDMAEENLANPQRIQKILSGRLFPMKALGYFGVVTGHGRKEESIADIKSYEEQFFRNSKLFRDSKLSSTQLTTKNLSFAVAEVFWKMVRETVEQQADAFKATRFNLETEWKNTYPGIRELDRDELFDKARGEILDEVINLSQVSVKDWDNLLLKKIWEKVSPHVINNIYLPAAQSLNTRTFNTMVDIRVKEWAESELAGKSIEAGEEALRQVLIDFIEKSMRSKSNGDAIFDDLKRAVVMEALERHKWEDKGNEMLRMIQLNTLEDHCVNDKQQWDSAVRLLEQTLKSKAQETEEQLKAMVGPGAKEKWLYWKYSTEEQVKKGGIKNELEKVIFSDPDHGPTLSADELTAVRKNLQRAGFGEPSSEMILDTWPTVYAKHFINKSMLRAYGCRRGYYLYHHNQEEIECQDVVLFWRLEQMLKVTATALRQQVMNREARRLDKIIKQVLEDFSQDQELKVKLLQGRRVTLAEDLKRVRQIQEKLEEFIQALNKEK
uniref:Dynamin-like GTPase OPA1, mitochondrial n=2 Tax=Lygus hesperus TaxID=30085 RepID=A0A0A9YA90_LYGHE